MVKTSRKVTIFRSPSQDDGTLGVVTDGVFHARTMELPWKNNKTDVSCIPEGNYHCEIVHSRSHGFVYYVKDVPERAGILFHSGNVAGDTNLNYQSDSEGCILIGEYTGYLNGQRAVLNSRKTLFEFTNYLERKPFRLNIQNIYR